MSDPEPETTVYRHSRPRAGGSLPVVHTDRECRYLERSRRVHSYEWSVLHDDTPICQHCRGAYEAHSPGSAGPWQALEAMDADDLVTDGGQDERLENVRNRDAARYECRCGRTVTFHEDEFDHLHWLKRKFGYKNVSGAIAHQTQCCQRPEYMEVSG